MTHFEVLTDIKNKLSYIPNITSLKIGLESGIGSKDCPFIRIISESNTQTLSKDTLLFSVVYGFDVKNKDLESMYEKMYDLEKSIRDTLEYNTDMGDCFFVSTQTDEDKLNNLKSAVSRFKIENIRL